MANLKQLVAALSLGLAALSGAHAGYAVLSPPGGWSAPVAAGERAMYRAAANETWTAARTVLTDATLNLGGRAVTMPAAMRMASNAPLYAARAMFFNPLLLGAGLAAWALLSNIQWDAELQKWTRPVQGNLPSTGLLYRVVFTGGEDLEWVGDAEIACNNAMGRLIAIDHIARSGRIASGECKITFEEGDNRGLTIGLSIQAKPDPNCPVGWWRTPAGCQQVPQRQPMTQPEFEQQITANPMPSSVPQELPPGTPLPVDDPIINPSPSLQPQPMRVPQGDPQAIPDTNPQQYRQPVARVTPSPTTTSPWRVDVAPEDIISTDPNGIKDPKTVESTDPQGNPKDPDLCEKNPDILACAKPNLDTPPDTPLPTREAQLTVTPDGGWGGDSAQCPAPRHISPMGRDIPIPFDLFCMYMAGLKPIIIAMAWLMAGLIVFAKAD